MKLQLGSRKRYLGWKALDIQEGPEVDYVGNCGTLTQFDDDTIEALYASHVLEHIHYADVPGTLAEWYRVVRPGGKLMVAVPDMNILSQLFVKPELKVADKVLVMLMMFGGQSDHTDFHYAGFDLELLGAHLLNVGFEGIRRVPSFGLFQDSSLTEFHGVNISLNVEARKPRRALDYE
jgi:predicted SAM-dependent methyltransferase